MTTGTTTAGVSPAWGWRPFSVFAGLLARPASAVGTVIVLVFLLIALIGPAIAPYGVNEQIASEARRPPSTDHWFGTDHLGRDVFSRVLYGARDILMLAGLGTLLAVLLGSAIGLFSGYRGGKFDEVLMRVFDSLLAIPALLLALLLLGVVGPARNAIFVVIVFVYTPIVARVARSVVLSVKSKGFVQAARMRGESQSWIIFREILPSVIPALSVESALRFSYAIFLIAALGFLGIGVQPPNPNWGLMVAEAREYAIQTPWALWIPALAISILVIGVNLTADGLRRVMKAPGA